MSHETKILDYKKLSNGQFSVLIQCCGDHASWHTMAATVDVEDFVSKARARVAAEHEAANVAQQKLEGIVASIQKHD